MSSQRGKGAKITGVTILDENITVKELEVFLVGGFNPSEKY